MHNAWPDFWPELKMNEYCQTCSRSPEDPGSFLQAFQESETLLVHKMYR